MSDHLSLIVVLTMTLIYGWLRAYARYERDWCGIRLLPRVGVQITPSVIVICALYFEFIHILHWQIFRDYFVLISFIAAIGGEYVAGKMLHDSATPKKGAVVRIATRIAVKKVELADALTASSRCSEILVNAITTSDLASRQQRAFLNGLSTPPTREQIIRVINAVGVAHIKVMV